MTPERKAVPPPFWGRPLHSWAWGWAVGGWAMPGDDLTHQHRVESMAGADINLSSWVILEDEQLGGF